MKKIIDSYFDFSRSERRGFLVLSLLLVLFVSAPSIYKIFKSKPNTDFQAFEKAVAFFDVPTDQSSIVSNTSISGSTQKQTNISHLQLFTFNPNTLSADSLALLGLHQKVINNIVNYRNKGGRFYKKENFKKIYSLADSTYQQLANYINIPQKQKTRPLQASFETKRSGTAIPPSNVKPVNFDPNTADKDLLLQIGLSEKVVNVISNFRNKGGKFYKKEDLQKIYGLSPAQYQQLASYITIEKNETKKASTDFTAKATSPYPSKKQAPSEPIDINRANQEDWQSLKGIGPFYSKKIVEYREKLGGFIKVDQVKEIYGLPDSVFQKIKPFLKTSDFIKKINLNTTTKEDLAKHPYLKFKQAKIIINYRKQHGDFKSIEDLNKVGIFNAEFIEKVGPYLDI